MFFLTHIIKKAYVILIIAELVQYLFFNNYINWDQFKILYNKDFDVKKTFIANKIIAQLK